MFKWEQSEIVEAHRLTVAMVWALLGVGTVRPSTWAALIRRGLAERADDSGYRFTSTGQDVADELYNLTTDEPEVPAPREPQGLPTVIEPRTVTADEVGAGENQPSEAEHEPSRTALSTADAVRSGDVLVWRGERRRVLGTWTEHGERVISTYEGTLIMPPGTPVRVDPVEQLALVG
ncbi:hypothetical protein [Pseudonocardia sp. ICBG162]|uniref:hypothetical protein n=1 Tax=Pseudonocardia sp. ICBG162 TaxID=2846761 RepID=UPI001CF630B9|nr:hypothetical protein [Pseudonocardia sp. ICBG162]